MIYVCVCVCWMLDGWWGQHQKLNQPENLIVWSIFELMTPSSILSFEVPRSPINVRQAFPRALYYPEKKQT